MGAADGEFRISNEDAPPSVARRLRGTRLERGFWRGGILRLGWEEQVGVWGRRCSKQSLPGAQHCRDQCFTPGYNVGGLSALSIEPLGRGWRGFWGGGILRLEWEEQVGVWGRRCSKQPLPGAQHCKDQCFTPGCNVGGLSALSIEPRGRGWRGFWRGGILRLGREEQVGVWGRRCSKQPLPGAQHCRHQCFTPGCNVGGLSALSIAPRGTRRRGELLGMLEDGGDGCRKFEWRFLSFEWKG
ncbi:hypothetical protein Cflav_PD4436 [Pedosphaera parvula Ellin514]|uniref:Uncharacterized protein n=1 Tax=Pedosphaera parvula (strain Ellin514) TaxID=320771 RepID=B9XFQ1_PEDPL|nr:hypothetical protein Cflav_PD4436 [Pedosphaera parvula Ellin514]